MADTELTRVVGKLVTSRALELVHAVNKNPTQIDAVKQLKSRWKDRFIDRLLRV